MTLRYRLPIHALLLAVLILIDQFSKYAVRENLLPLQLNYICNEGVAFGIHLPTILFWIFWSVAVTTLILLFSKKDSTYGSFFITLLLAGTLSNILDRVRLGCVIDFINLPFWPIFNLADIYITIGSMILLLNLSRKNK